MLPDGKIEVLGRINNQVKIRGYRVEPGEVESLLGDYPGISMCAVVTQQDTLGDDFLVAYYTSAAPTESNNLRQYLHKRLPDYMIPSIFIHLDQMPVNANGKLDKRALPPPRQCILTLPNNEPPRTELEITISRIWQEVLGIQQPGVNDNFFDIGGDSIKAIQVTARLKRHGMELKVSDLFLHPTIKESAKCVDAAVVEEEEEDSLTFSDPEFSSISSEQLDAFEDEFSDID